MNISIRKDTRKLLVVTFVILPLLNLFIGGSIIGMVMANELIGFDLNKSYDEIAKMGVILSIFFYLPFLVVQLLWVIGMWCKKFID